MRHIKVEYTFHHRNERSAPSEVYTVGNLYTLTDVQRLMQQIIQECECLTDWTFENEAFEEWCEEHYDVLRKWLDRENMDDVYLSPPKLEHDANDIWLWSTIDNDDGRVNVGFNCRDGSKDYSVWVKVSDITTEVNDRARQLSIDFDQEELSEMVALHERGRYKNWRDVD